MKGNVVRTLGVVAIAILAVVIVIIGMNINNKGINTSPFIELIEIANPITEVNSKEEMKKENITINGIEFKYNEKEKAYEKVIHVNNKNVIVVIYESYVNDRVNEALNYATNYINNLDLNLLKKIIVEQLYQPNDEWYGVGENGQAIEYTKQEYTSKLELKAISVDLNSVEYWFNDNGLYAGHDITIYKKHENNEYKVELAG